MRSDPGNASPKAGPSSQDIPVHDHALEDVVQRVLARKPPIQVPEDFSRRVTTFVLAQPATVRSRWVGWGPRLSVLSAGLLTVGMFALAPHATPSLNNIAFDGELLLLAELGGLLLFAHPLLSND